MDEIFANREAKVLIVEPQSSVRQLLNEAVRGQGFNNFILVESTKEAIPLLEAEPIDWVITSLFANNPVNSLQLLKLFTQKEMELPKLTLIVEESETSCLQFAFEMGLLSWIRKPLTRDTIQREIAELVQYYERSGWNSQVTSSRYLHKWLLAQGKEQLSFTFEKMMLEKYPANPVLLFMLGETQFSLKQQEAGFNTLQLLKMTDPRFEKEIQEVIDRESGGKKINLTHTTPNFSVFGVSKCLVIEPDDVVRKQIVEILQRCGVTTVVDFADGESGFQWVKEKNQPQLIIQEWRIPKIAGPILLQRFRNEGLSEVPVFIVSSYVQQTDVPLLKEMGAAGVVGKPFEEKRFVDGLLNALLQNSLANDYSVIERRIRQALAAGRRSEADELRVKLDGLKGVTLGIRRYIDAEFAFAENDFNAAREAAIDAARYGNETVLVLNLLGKSLMKLGDFDFALRCFTNAQNLSPQNVERLCNIAETNLELAEQQKRDEAIDKAKEMDADAQVVKETQAKIAITTGDTELAEEALSDLESLVSFFSFMNNKAVAMSKSGKFEGAADLYANVINALKTKKPAEWYVVSYNLALSQIKMENLAKAEATLKYVVENKQSRVYEKAAVLLKKVTQAIAAGEKTVQLNRGSSASQPNDSAQSSKNEKLQAMLEKKEFAQCCYGLFSNPDPVPSGIKALVAHLPQFNLRDAIRFNRLGAVSGDDSLK